MKILTVVSLSCAVLCYSAQADVRVVIPSGAERAVRIAADEFAKFHEKVTGFRPPVDTAAVGEGPFVRIGIPEKDMTFPSETDSYRIRSVGKDLVLAGKNGRSTLYAVYDFFRLRAHAAYFWDGDTFDHLPALDFSGLDVFERSRFEYRACQYFAHRGLTRFNAEHWGFEDWKREIDWAVKNRLNIVRLCLGIEDLFQRAFPDVVPYPDPSVTMDNLDSRGYDKRSPFWSLEYRSLLRRAVFDYAMARGLQLPVEFGPQTHWYARTPQAFLDTYKPEFMPQVENRYGQPSGLIWDCRKDKWFDMYFRLSEAALDTYGYTGLMFNPGFDERTVYSNRADNVKLKVDILKRFNDEATRRHPDAKLLMEGWDFYLTWKPDEMHDLFEVLDPKTTIIWDFMADAQSRNFIDWGVTNRFPYVFGYTLAHERGLDIRCNYELIRKNEAAIRNDPMCKGYCIWPENSHSDIFGWRYFTDNCWNLSDKSLDELLAAFCRDRYGRQAPTFERAWRALIPHSKVLWWSNNCFGTFVGDYRRERNDAARWRRLHAEARDLPAAEILASLADVDWEDSDFVLRDGLDIVRTVLDRKLINAFESAMGTYCDCKEGKATVADVKARTAKLVSVVSVLTDVLALHTDYSITESLDRLNMVERVRNPNFEHILFENAACDYCMSHQVELAKGWYLPQAKELATLLVARAEAKDFSPLPPATNFRDRMYKLAHPIRTFSPDPFARTPQACAQTVRKALALFQE